jgi:hypothetical protein
MSLLMPSQGACVDLDKMLLITEYMDGGDLSKAIARKQVNWSLRWGRWCQPMHDYVMHFDASVGAGQLRCRGPVTRQT